MPDMATNNSHPAFSVAISVAGARSLYHIRVFSCVVSPPTTSPRSEPAIHPCSVFIPQYAGREVRWSRSRLYHVGPCIVGNVPGDVRKRGIP